MSLTLRDAQYLCLKTSKKIKNNRELSVRENSILAINEEDLKKIASQIVDTMTNLATSADYASTKILLSKHLSDLLFATLLIAEEHGINLEEAFLQRIDDLILEFSI